MFQKPMISQDESPLLALPSEIRTPILKYLVTSTEAIPVAHESDDEAQQVHVSILGTCQQLYHEGLSLFMRYNIPRVSITLHAREVWVMNWHNGRDGPVGNIAYNEFLKDTIPKFSRLRFEFNRSMELATESRKCQVSVIKGAVGRGAEWLNKCDLREKEVTLAFEPKILERLKPYFYPYRRYWIFMFDEIRCKKLIVPGMDGPHLANLTCLVEGRVIISDFEAASDEIIDHFRHCRFATGRYMGSGVQDDGGRDERLESNMKEAALRRDTTVFEAARAKIVSRCDVLFEEFKAKHEGFKAAASRPLLID